jgi:hypothetical protein
MPICHKPERAAFVAPRCNLDPRTPATINPANTNSWINLRPLQAMIALGLAVLTALLAAPAGRAQTPNPTSPPATTQPQPSAKTLHDWRRSMSRVPLPKRGCFTSSYPSGNWQEVPCTTAPARPYPPARGPRSDTVGNGVDVSAQVTGHISEAIGSFDSVTGVTSESGNVDGSPPPQPNTFSLQLNSSFFSTSVCNGASIPSQCRGWQQFVYSNAGFVFVQYWLLSYNTTCPAGWNTFTTSSGNDCWKNGSNSAVVPVQPIANLVNLSLTGQANAGGADTVIMATGSNLYSAENDGSILNLALGWQAVEFNIVGDCCLSQAIFNSGSTIVVRTSVDNASPNAPSCLAGGFTGETNNLNLVQASAAPPMESLPAVVFTQSNIGNATSPCSSATPVSASSRLTDSHDFNGDGKSDIVWRDTGGNTALWLMNGAALVKSTGLGTVPTTWSVFGQRDFDGDGKADWLWHDIGGNVAMWFFNGAQVTQFAGVGTVPTTWSIVGTGDFNGDGKGDVLWHDTNGNVAIWLMNGAEVTKAYGIGNAPTAWSIVGTGDFNGDGYSDILWRDTSGNVAIWFAIQGNPQFTPTGVGNAPTAWSIVETGDFDGDGLTDILWRDASGNVAIWFMFAAHVKQSTGVGNAPTVWSIQGGNAD